MNRPTPCPECGGFCDCAELCDAIKAKRDAPAPMRKRPAIQVAATGAITCTGEGIALFSLLALRGAVKLEKLGMHRRGRSAASIARERLGLKPRAPLADVLAQLEKAIAEQGAKCRPTE